MISDSTHSLRVDPSAIWRKVDPRFLACSRRHPVQTHSNDILALKRDTHIMRVLRETFHPIRRFTFQNMP